MYQKQSVLRKSERGMTLVEILIVAFVLAVVGFGSAYHIAQSKIQMRSMAQTGSCPQIVRESLEQFVGFGTRLYGYSYDGTLAHTKDHPKFRPLLIKKTSQTGQSNNFTDVRNGSSLTFPTIVNNILSQLSINLGNGNIGDWANTGVDIIRIDNQYNVHLGSSVFLINQVNVLQYLYNTDSSYFTGNSGKGKKFSMSNHPELKKYAQKYGLQDINLYVLIRPVDLKSNAVITSASNIECGKLTGGSYTTYSCPTNGSHKLLLTRPRLATQIKNQIPSYIVLHGNPNLGFELKMTLEYQKRDTKGNNQDLSCEAMQSFTHQMDTMKRETPPSGVTLLDLQSVKTWTTDDDDDDKILTSCDSHSSGNDYKDIDVELNFFNAKTKERGTILVCRGDVGCVTGNGKGGYSGTDQNGKSVSCTYKEGKWSRCHKVKFPDQVANTKAEMTSNSSLKLSFDDLQENRRYDLYIGELSTAGTFSQVNHVARFYVDAKRPNITQRKIPDTDVGKPNDGGTGSRNYVAHSSGRISWDRPNDSISSSKWLQCNKEPVDFTSKVEDQFNHNFKPCEQGANRKDGTGTTDKTSNLKNKKTGSVHDKCNGTLTLGALPMVVRQSNCLLKTPVKRSL